MLRWIICLFGILVLLNVHCIIPAYSQWISVPLPSSITSKSINCCNGSFSNTTSSNKGEISILTYSLLDGKNVIKFKIKNDKPLIFKSLQYTSGNNTLTTNLAKSLGDEYRALINVHPPETKLSLITSNDGIHATHFDKILMVQNEDFWSKLVKVFKNLLKW